MLLRALFEYSSSYVLFFIDIAIRAVKIPGIYPDYRGKAAKRWLCRGLFEARGVRV
jgi:hypothetical protein